MSRGCMGSQSHLPFPPVRKMYSAYGSCCSTVVLSPTRVDWSRYKMVPTPCISQLPSPIHNWNQQRTRWHVPMNQEFRRNHSGSLDEVGSLLLDTSSTLPNKLPAMQRIKHIHNHNRNTGDNIVPSLDIELTDTTNVKTLATHPNLLPVYPIFETIFIKELVVRSFMTLCA